MNGKSIREKVSVRLGHGQNLACTKKIDTTHAFQRFIFNGLPFTDFEHVQFLSFTWFRYNNVILKNNVEKYIS